MSGPEASGSPLDPRIVAFRTEAFDLGEDLGNLVIVHRQGLIEATVFYGARILEALSAEAVGALGLGRSRNAYSNLTRLAELNLMPAPVPWWAHALRRLGNETRHLHRRHQPSDSNLAVLFTERWLEWYFCSFELGLRLEGIVDPSEESPLRAAAAPDLGAVVEALDCSARSKETDAFDAILEAEVVTHFHRAPVLAGVAVEVLLSRERFEDADRLLAQSLAAHPDDLRLRQLQALHLSRTGELERARDGLEPLVRDGRDDPETMGILAGVYKRIWRRDPEDRAALGRSQRTYRSGWKRARGSSTYLAVNAAATSLWLGRHDEARAMAEDCRRVLEERREVMARFLGAGQGALGFWDLMTSAETNVILGRFGDARREYAAAFERFAERTGDLQVVREQLARNLEALGLAASAEEFCSLPAPPGGEPFLVGVTGHRRIADVERVAAEVGAILTRLRREDPSRRLAALSPLAEGADRLVARAVLESGPDAGLCVPLPLELDDYRTDCASSSSTDELADLLVRADRLIFPEGLDAIGRADERGAGPTSGDARDEAYERSGRYVLEHASVLLALWDGRPARGRGGTGQIVEEARRRGTPVEVVRVERREP